MERGALPRQPGVDCLNTGLDANKGCRLMAEKKRDRELAVSGFRDFYPELYRKIDHILDIFRRVPKLFGYVEYECPTVEPLKLYEMKSGAALIEETFTVIDRKDRRLVLRPETTPSLARMLAEQQQYYPRPIRWFSISRVFRDESPQRGRVKEFWQLNVDLLGVEDVGADAEVIDVLATIIKTVGFKPTDFVIRINDRRLIQSYIESLGLTNYVEIIRQLDRRDRILQETLEQRLQEHGQTPEKAAQIALQLRHSTGTKADLKLVRSAQLKDIVRQLPNIRREALIEALQQIGVPPEAAAKLTDFSSISGSPRVFLKNMETLPLKAETRASLGQLRQLATHLQDLGVEDCCEYDASIARGLDYYTGIVFEAWNRGGQLVRAIAGGGRYDDLVAVFEGERLPGTGFGFGETVILELAEEFGLIPPPTPQGEVYLAPVSEKQLPACRQLATRLRTAGIGTVFNGFVWSLKKHLEDAGKRQIRLALIVGPRELEKNVVNVRDMVSGKEREVGIDGLVDFVRTFSSSGKSGSRAS
jgi:histidyl-tRNA synthetase